MSRSSRWSTLRRSPTPTTRPLPGARWVGLEITTVDRSSGASGDQVLVDGIGSDGQPLTTDAVFQGSSHEIGAFTECTSMGSTMETGQANTICPAFLVPTGVTLKSVGARVGAPRSPKPRRSTRPPGWCRRRRRLGHGKDREDSAMTKEELTALPPSGGPSATPGARNCCAAAATGQAPAAPPLARSPARHAGDRGSRRCSGAAMALSRRIEQAPRDGLADDHRRHHRRNRPQADRARGIRLPLQGRHPRRDGSQRHRRRRRTERRHRSDERGSTPIGRS